MGYTVKKNLVGQHRVHYRCSGCQGELESPLQEAGQAFKCPVCGVGVVTPGDRELGAIRQADEQQRLRDAEQRAKRAASQQATAEAAAQAAAVHRGQAKAAQDRAATGPNAYPEIVKGRFWLGVAASILRAFGILDFIGAAVGVLLAVIAQDPAARYSALTFAGACAFAGALFFGFGSLLNFVGSVGLAVRDIAIDTRARVKSLLVD